ncbi:plasminogen activator inhibitor 1 RNA-binding protein [Quillaja saponaria]|uniref:Plasminogen activator inhibitor 1 RNA-binding protein n=1 Tax=Quillaja saponaria TaxID=32244 RepID=A0AAD7KTI1_QUISA|nr:plasminogen activator inhibitor 1 RNA-binding protein [Quillaja saponaria]
MATTNPFDLLGDDDNEDPSQLIAAQQPRKTPAAAPVAAQPAKPAKLPSKPLPPSQAVREARTETGRGGGRGGGRGYGRGRGGGFNRDNANTENAFGGNNGFSGGYRPSEDGEKASERRGSVGPRAPFRGGRRGGSSNGEASEGERPRRAYERRSGTGRGNEFKRDGAGLGNWGTPNEEIAQETEEPSTENEKNFNAEKQIAEEDATDANKENPVTEPEEKEEDKEMTLEEYEKVLEEKRKALLALKTEERKVDVDKEFETMQPLSSKKGNDDIFIKLGSEKDKRKDEKDEKAKKSVSINEFLKPTEGERYYNPGGRGRGRGRVSRGGYGGGNYLSSASAPAIEDQSQFPSLGAK